MFADTLSRIYGNEPPGIQRSKSEYVGDYDGEELGAEGKVTRVTRPLLAGYAAELATAACRNPERNRRAPTRYDPSIPGRDVPKKSRSARAKAPRHVMIEEIHDPEAPEMVNMDITLKARKQIASWRARIHPITTMKQRKYPTELNQRRKQSAYSGLT